MRRRSGPVHGRCAGETGPDRGCGKPLLRRPRLSVSGHGGVEGHSWRPHQHADLRRGARSHIASVDNSSPTKLNMTGLHHRDCPSDWNVSVRPIGPQRGIAPDTSIVAENTYVELNTRPTTPTTPMFSWIGPWSATSWRPPGAGSSIAATGRTGPNCIPCSCAPR